MIIQLVIQVQSNFDLDFQNSTFKEITVLGDPEGIRELHYILERVGSSSEKVTRLTVKNLDGITVSRKDFFQHPNADASSLSYNCNRY